MSTAPDLPAVEVRLLGPLLVSVPGEARVQSGRALTLLGLLASQHGHFVATDTIVEALWGKTATDRAARNVAALISRLRRALGSETVVGDRHGYRLALSERITLDLDQAERLVARAQADEAHGSPALRRRWRLLRPWPSGS